MEGEYGVTMGGGEILVRKYKIHGNSNDFLSGDDTFVLCCDRIYSVSTLSLLRPPGR